MPDANWLNSNPFYAWAFFLLLMAVFVSLALVQCTLCNPEPKKDANLTNVEAASTSTRNRPVAIPSKAQSTVGSQSRPVSSTPSKGPTSKLACSKMSTGVGSNPSAGLKNNLKGKRVFPGKTVYGGEPDKSASSSDKSGGGAGVMLAALNKVPVKGVSLYTNKQKNLGA